ncbi:MAG: hypothetical protein L3J42_01640, partial [Hydrogenimonas sp.]|nr:hypothetical protein [Hydrogenimonas sp.]
LLPLLSPYRRGEMAYFIYDEFANKIRGQDGGYKMVESAEDMLKVYNEDRFDPIDGTLIKVADNIGAFIEAAASIRNGVNPPSLIEAKSTLLKKYKNYSIFGIDVEKILMGLEG